MSKTKNRTELIIKVLKHTAAYKANGICFEKKKKKVLIYNAHGADFLATGLFDCLGAFKTFLKADKNRVVLVVQ